MRCSYPVACRCPARSGSSQLQFRLMSLSQYDIRSVRYDEQRWNKRWTQNLGSGYYCLFHAHCTCIRDTIRIFSRHGRPQEFLQGGKVYPSLSSPSLLFPLSLFPSVPYPPSPLCYIHVTMCRQCLCQRYCSYPTIVLCIHYCKWVAHVNLLINGDDDDDFAPSSPLCPSFSAAKRPLKSSHGPDWGEL